MTTVRRHISDDVRKAVEREFRFRRSHCLTPQEITGLRLQIDHIIPEARGGMTVMENLCLACISCNRAKAASVAAIDPISGHSVLLFDPRRQTWHEHFRWSEDGTEIVGRTACGRATVMALQMNNERLVGARSLWVQAGWWPPDS